MRECNPPRLRRAPHLRIPLRPSSASYTTDNPAQFTHPRPPLSYAVVEEVYVREGGAAHHGVSEVFQGEDVGVAGPDAVVGEGQVHQRAIAGKPRRQSLGPLCFQPITLHRIMVRLLAMFVLRVLLTGGEGWRKTER